MSAPAAPDHLRLVARRRHTRQLITTSVTVFVLLTVMSLLDDRGAGPFDAHRFTIGLVASAVGMIVVTLVLLGLRRAGVRWLQPSPALGLDRAERRAAARALRPGGVVEPEHRESTLVVARDVRRYPWAPAFFLVVGAVNLWAVSTEAGPVRWVYGGCGVIGVVMSAYHYYAQRKAGAIDPD